MAPKKAKSDVVNPKAVPNREVHQRLSFLYQASTLLSSASARSRDHVRSTETSAPVASTSTLPTEPSHLAASPSPTSGRRRKRFERETGAALVARSMTSTMRGVAKKAVVRMDPAVKRTICKSCATLLQPGLTSKVRTKASGPHGRVVVHTCLGCSTRRVLPAPPLLTREELITTGLRMNSKERKRRSPRRLATVPFTDRSDHTTFLHHADQPVLHERGERVE